MASSRPVGEGPRWLPSKLGPLLSTGPHAGHSELLPCCSLCPAHSCSAPFHQPRGPAPGSCLQVHRGGSQPCTCEALSLMSSRPLDSHHPGIGPPVSVVMAVPAGALPRGAGHTREPSPPPTHCLLVLWMRKLRLRPRPGPRPSREVKEEACRSQGSPEPPAHTHGSHWIRDPAPAPARRSLPTLTVRQRVNLGVRPAQGVRLTGQAEGLRERRARLVPLEAGWTVPPPEWASLPPGQAGPQHGTPWSSVALPQSPASHRRTEQGWSTRTCP